MQVCDNIYLACNHSQFISIRSRTQNAKYCQLCVLRENSIVALRPLSYISIATHFTFVHMLCLVSFSCTALREQYTWEIMQ